MTVHMLPPNLAWRTRPSTSPNLLGLDPDQIWTTLSDLSAIGNRFHATPGEARAAAYLTERFRQLGCESVRAEPFRYLAYRPGEVSIHIVDGTTQTLRCSGLQYSAVGDVSGQVRYLGSPTSVADLDRLCARGLDVRGRIAVLDTLYVGKLTPWLVDQGAIGVIVISPAPDGFLGNFIACSAPPPLRAPWHERPGPLPGVTVEREGGRQLVAAAVADPELRVELVHHPAYEEVTGHNLVGSLPGGDPSRHVVVGCHYDSQVAGPCVWDNGSGVAGMLEIGRVLATCERTMGIRLIAFGAEEPGLWGSTHYVDQHASELDEIVAMVNIDGAGSRYPSRHTAIVTASLRDLAAEVAAHCEWPIDELHDADDHPHVDSWSFASHGVPSAIFLEYPPLHPYYHSEGDVLDLLDPERLASTAGVAGALVANLCR